MVIVFEIMKGFFFFFSLIAAIVVLRGPLLFGEELSSLLVMVIIPGYLVLCGIMIAYVFVQLWKTGHEDDLVSSSFLVKTFVGGVVLGSMIAASYVMI